MKRKNINIAISTTIVLVISISLYSCCMNTPKFIPYDYGMLDGMPEGTKVVFISNSGKKDTCVFNSFNQHRDYSYKGRGPCHEDYDITYQEDQKVYFYNKFGFNNLKYSRLTKIVLMNWGDCRGVEDSLVKLNLSIDTLYKSINLTKFNKSYTVQNLIYNDCAEATLLSKDLSKYAYILYSKRFGIVRLKYYNAYIDSVFELKEVIY